MNRPSPSASSAHHELLERDEVPIVRLPERGKVSPSSYLDVTRTGSRPPRERRLFQHLYQEIGSLAAMPAVAVRERVDRHEAVVEADGDAQAST